MIRAKDEFLIRAHDSCRDIQQNTLTRLLRLNADSQFSAKHGLRPDLTPAGFRARLPVTDYEFFRESIDRMKVGEHSALLGTKNPLLMFAVTSGTTAEPKLIPVTRQFVNDYRRGWQFWGMGAYQSRPSLSLLRIVQLSSSHQRWTTADGTPCGNISGLASSMQKAVVRKLYSIPSAVAEVSCSVQKLRIAATFALADQWVGMMITANPSTLLQMMKAADADADEILMSIHDGRFSKSYDADLPLKRLSKLLHRSPQRARDLQSIFEREQCFRPKACWPNLNCLGIWTGGSAGTYLPQIRKMFGDVSIRDHGLHASEGRMTIPFESETASGILDVDTHFFEFMPYAEADSAQPVILQAHELQQDADYFILLTTSSGLYRYNIRDVVRCTGFHGSTPLVKFLHKGAHISSITGEKITESQVVNAVQSAVQQTDCELQIFTLTPTAGDPPGYILFVDGDKDHTQLSPPVGLADAADRCLRKVNCEYDEKRASGRLSGIVCRTLKPEVWRRFQVNRLAASGGSPEQYKHPFLFPDSKLQGEFSKLADAGHSASSLP